MTNPEIPQMIAIGIIFLFSIKEFFAYLRARMNGNNGTDYATQLALVNNKLDNHITHIEEDIKEIKLSQKEQLEAIIKIRETIAPLKVH